MADKRPLDDGELDSLFAAAQARAPVPPDDLIARILAEAQAQAEPVGAPEPRATGLWRAILGSIGGWPAATGLASATVAGLAIGLGAPDALDTLSGGYLASVDSVYELEDLLPSYADILGEG